jgi:hypothetical protein
VTNQRRLQAALGLFFTIKFGAIPCCTTLPRGARLIVKLVSLSDCNRIVKGCLRSLQNEPITFGFGFVQGLGQGLPRTMKDEKEKLPVHDQFSQSCEFLRAQRFS